ncbi:lantibiotic dehydratase [Kitasatospora sp. NPDC096128]|uniref:lantibiotic dehydratase n=1 Tax=Kitasatospora sp. NPDC096128 TaxID=3155547 RepID=UPI0033291A63
MTDQSAPSDRSAPTDRHLVPLDGTAWALWQDVALRSTGFPADELDRLCDRELASAADRVGETPEGDGHYRQVYLEATERLGAAIRHTAAQPAFREAVTWQNPSLVPVCLDKAARGEPRNFRGRSHELTIARYLQRYTQKNETVGFFGPVGWARLDRTVPGLTVAPGPRLLRRRTTYFEVWAVDALATALGARDDVQPWLRPRLGPSCGLAGRVLRLPLRKPIRLPVPEARLLRLCDGVRTLREVLALAGRPEILGDEATAHAALLRLRQLGAVELNLLGPVHAWPERLLRERLEAIGDPVTRASALAPLDELIAGRDAVDGAAGDPEKLMAATDALREAFVRHTGVAAERRPGQTYAGRTLVYQDAVRDVRVRLGRQVLEAAAAPLGLVLDSARWLTARVADRYHELFRGLFTAARARAGTADEGGAVPLPRLLAEATPELLTATPRELPPLVAGVVADFQQRWRDLLRVPDGVRHHRVAVEAVAREAAALFPPDTARWANAVQHSPDLMIAAADAGAVDRGDFLLVLGELHLAVNTLESRMFVEQHDEPERLLAAAAADARGRRVYAVPRRGSAFVTSRLSPPSALLSPEFTYWCAGEAAVDPPVAPLAGADLDVLLDGARLVVRVRGQERGFDLLEVIGELLTASVANAFRPLRTAPHRPRITLDRLVLCRESWTVDPAEAEWASRKDEGERFAAARAWAARYGVPERVFVKLPVELKPVLVDFGSLPLVNLLAKGIRRTVEEAPGATVTLTEAMPDNGGCWLPDARGRRYTSELRMVAVDRQPAATPDRSAG